MRKKILSLLLMITLIVGVVCLNALPVFSASGSTSNEVTVDAFDFDKTSTNGQTAVDLKKLKFYYEAGRIRNDTDVINVVAGYVTCTASQRNFIEVSPAGVVSAESSFTAGSIPLYVINASATAIQTPVDKRAFLIANTGNRLCEIVETDTNLTLTSALHSGKIVTNDGATTSITLTLPAAAAGLLVNVVHTDTDNVKVVAAGSDTILGTTNDSYVYIAGTAGGAISLVGVTTTDTPVWVRFSSEGTWTDTTVLP